MYIESVMLDIDHKLNNCHENIQVIRRHLEILRQIHVCPATYLSAVAEVVRRRAFSQAFLLVSNYILINYIFKKNMYDNVINNFTKYLLYININE